MYSKYITAIEHPQGTGSLVHRPCSVKFRLFKPRDIRNCPYIIWTSHGIHEHPLPPSSRTHRILLDNITSLIQQMDEPSSGTSSILLIFSGQLLMSYSGTIWESNITGVQCSK